MRPVATDVTWSACARVCPAVYLLDTNMICAKTDEPIKMLFGVLTRVSPLSRILGGGGTNPPREGTLLAGHPWHVHNCRHATYST